MAKASRRSGGRRIATALRHAISKLVDPLADKRGVPPPTQWSDQQIHNAVANVRAGPKLTPDHWANNSRVAVCISCDLDNETLSLSQGKTAPALLSMGEFGATNGLRRLLDLLDRHNIPSSFYVPAVSAMLHPHMIEEIMERRHHEIGVHGWIHENLQAVNDRSEEKRLLYRAIEYLTRVSGKRPVGHRAPSWAFSKYTVGLLCEAGFLYDSSLMAMDEPYELIADGRPTGVIELPVEWILDDAPYFGRTGTMPSPELVFKAYRDEFDVAYEEGTLFMLTLHSHIIGHRSRILHLDKLVRYLKSRPGVWFATAEQIAAYVQTAVKRQ